MKKQTEQEKYYELKLKKHNLGEPLLGYRWVWNTEDQCYYMRKGE